MNEWQRCLLSSPWLCPSLLKIWEVPPSRCDKKYNTSFSLKLVLEEVLLAVQEIFTNYDLQNPYQQKILNKVP